MKVKDYKGRIDRIYLKSKDGLPSYCIDLKEFAECEYELDVYTEDDRVTYNLFIDDLGGKK